MAWCCLPMLVSSCPTRSFTSLTNYHSPYISLMLLFFDQFLSGSYTACSQSSLSTTKGCQLRELVTRYLQSHIVSFQQWLLLLLCCTLPICGTSTLSHGLSGAPKRSTNTCLEEMALCRSR